MPVISDFKHKTNRVKESVLLYEIITHCMILRRYLVIINSAKQPVRGFMMDQSLLT